jgi:putative ABC transport system permease protein
LKPGVYRKKYKNDKNTEVKIPFKFCIFVNFVVISRTIRRKPMTWLRVFMHRLHGLFFRRRVERQLEEEIRSHLEMQIEDDVRQGMSSEEAGQAARRKFGGVAQAKEAYRDRSGLPLVESTFQDLRYAARMLLKKPGFTSIAVITLALGIGANTAIFSVVNAVLLRPLPFQNPQQLFTLWESTPKLGIEQNSPAAGNYLDWQAQNRVFAQMAIYNPYRKFNLTYEDQPERIEGAAVSASLFAVLGVGAAQGRVFVAEEEQPGRDRVVIISHGLWRRRFAGDPNLVGKTITLDGGNCTVIGVMPEGFQFPGGSGKVRTFTTPPAELWVPLALDAATWSQRIFHYLKVIARLKPEIGIEQAQAEMNAIQQRLKQQYPNTNVGTHVKMVPLKAQVVGAAQPALLILWGAVALVLLIACVNVTNLLLSRATARKKELAIRAALGAGRLRVLRQLLTESLMLAFVGGVIGVILANWGIGALSGIIPEEFPRREEIAIDRWVLGFTLLVTALTSLIFGLVPALLSTKTDLTASLKEGGRSASEGGRRNRVHSLLVMTETALALILLVGAGLLIQTLLRLERVNPGFNPERVLTMELSMSPVRYPRDQRAFFFRRLIERVHALPEVSSVGASTVIPLAGGNNYLAVGIEGRQPPPGTRYGAEFRAVTPEYFKALGIPLVRGRTLSDRDGPEAPSVFVVNETMARRFFPNEDPLGKRIRLGYSDVWGEIVGIVGDVKHFSLDAEVKEEAYSPYYQAPFWLDMTLVVRTTVDPMSIANAVRNEILGLDKDQPVTRIRTMEAVVAGSVAQPRFRTLLLGVFAVMALSLAAIGIYGVISYAVTQRTREIGIRIALGARRRDVLRLVVGQGMAPAIVGLGIGLIGAFALTRLMKDLLFVVRADDPATFALVAFLLAAAALLACYIPARRAAKVDPMIALRSE